jgi:hypothetical protein
VYRDKKMIGELGKGEISEQGIMQMISGGHGELAVGANAR